MNDEIGYASFPSAFVIDTRKSAGIFDPAAAAAAAVTDCSVALTNSPAMFCTTPYEMLFCRA